MNTEQKLTLILNDLCEKDGSEESLKLFADNNLVPKKYVSPNKKYIAILGKQRLREPNFDDGIREIWFHIIRNGDVILCRYFIEIALFPKYPYDDFVDKLKDTLLNGHKEVARLIIENVELNNEKMIIMTKQYGENICAEYLDDIIFLKYLRKHGMNPSAGGIYERGMSEYIFKVLYHVDFSPKNSYDVEMLINNIGGNLDLLEYVVHNNKITILSDMLYNSTSYGLEYFEIITSNNVGTQDIETCHKFICRLFEILSNHQGTNEQKDHAEKILIYIIDNNVLRFLDQKILNTCIGNASYMKTIRENIHIRKYLSEIYKNISIVDRDTFKKSMENCVDIMFRRCERFDNGGNPEDEEETDLT